MSAFDIERRFRLPNMNQHTSWPARMNVLTMFSVVRRPAAMELFFC